MFNLDIHQRNLAEFVISGGDILPWIALAGLVMWTLIIERYWWYWRIFPKQRAAIAQRWAARTERSSWTATRIRSAMMSELTVAMNAPLPLLKSLIPICPLLGLLGTVDGMLQVFDVMAISGQGDPRAMAEGVSNAMIATLSGLGVALSGMYFSHGFVRRAERETERLNSILALDDQHGHVVRGKRL